MVVVRTKISSYPLLKAVTPATIQLYWSDAQQRQVVLTLTIHHVPAYRIHLSVQQGTGNEPNRKQRARNGERYIIIFRASMRSQVVIAGTLKMSGLAAILATTASSLGKGISRKSLLASVVIALHSPGRCVTVYTLTKQNDTHLSASFRVVLPSLEVMVGVVATLPPLGFSRRLKIVLMESFMFVTLSSNDPKRS